MKVVLVVWEWLPFLMGAMDNHLVKEILKVVYV